MRKHIAKITLLLTGILMLVVTLLPHHHHFHDGVEVLHFTTQQDCNDHAQTEDVTHNDQKGECEHNDTDCDLRQLFLLASRAESEHQSCHCHDAQSHFAHLYTLSFVTQQSNTEISDSKIYETHPFADPLRSESLIFDVNRRGPPFFVA